MKKQRYSLFKLLYILAFFSSCYTNPGDLDTGNTPLSEVTNTLGMKFVFIPAGTFTMGSSLEEKGRDRDERLHQVTMTRPFYLQKTEVTQWQWQTVMGNNPSHFNQCGKDCPVERVSWFDVQKFIKRLNKKEKSTSYPLPVDILSMTRPRRRMAGVASSDQLAAFRRMKLQ